MTCREIRFQLPDYISNTVSEQERLIVSDHLRACKACRMQAEDIRVLLGEIKNTSNWIPSDSYFDGLLPRIHSRIDQKRRRAIPEWVVKAALPLGAAFVMVLVLVRLVPPGENRSQDLQAILHQLQPDEIQQVADQQTLAEVTEPVTNDNEAAIIFSSGDKEIVKNLITDNKLFSVYSELDLRSATENLSDPEVDQLVAYLQSAPEAD